MNSDGWMPIETAPKDGTSVLLLTETRYGVGIGKWGKTVFGRHAWFCPRTAGWVSDNPTHWMPLPSPPKPVSNDL